MTVVRSLAAREHRGERRTIGLARIGEGGIVHAGRFGPRRVVVRVEKVEDAAAHRGRGGGWTGKGGETGAGHLTAEGSLAAGEHCIEGWAIGPSWIREWGRVGTAGHGPRCVVVWIEKVQHASGHGWACGGWIGKFGETCSCDRGENERLDFFK